MEKSNLVMIGNGDGDGDGYGYGNGYGDGDGNGYGNGNGNGNGYGNGYGYGDGNGYSDGNGNGNGYGYGYGYGDGNGNGYGDGNGDGDGNGYGYGYGDGNGDGIAFISHKTPVIAWHYLPPDMHTRFNISKKLCKGSVLNWRMLPELCSHGLHASLGKEDAKKYAGKDWILTKVACSGWIKFGGDKLVCARRKILESEK